jgi:hypothetical protein
MDSRDAIDTLKAFDMFWPPESLTWIVKLYEPAAVDAPQTIPAKRGVREVALYATPTAPLSKLEVRRW